MFDVIIDRASHFFEREAGIIVKKMLEAIAYLHSNNIVHRDLKVRT